MRDFHYNTLSGLHLTGDIIHKRQASSVATTELQRLIKLVYVKDERTNLPTGELSVLASDTVSPDIVDFVRRNLLQPIGDTGLSSVINNTQLDDDTIIQLTRNVGETDRQYIDRCDALLRDWNKPEES